MVKALLNTVSLPFNNLQSSKGFSLGQNFKWSHLATAQSLGTTGVPDAGMHL